MPLPILRTPFVVLSEIISLLEPNEIVTASFCSKNIKYFLKSHHQRRKPLEWKLLMIDYDGWGRADIAKSIHDVNIPVLLAKHISELNKSEHELIETNEYKRGFISKYPVLYFENLVMGSKMVVDYVSDLFSLDVNALVMDRVEFWAIDWINNRQEKMLDSIGFNQNPGYMEYGDVALDYVLRKAIASDCYILKGNFSDNFRFDGKLGPANHLLVYSNGHWVTPQNLMNFDFINIVIEKSRISISDLNSFLRHWRAGGSNRLKILQLGFENDTNIENFGGELGMEVLEGGYYSIQRDDGVTAVIKFGIRSFIMSVVPQEEII